MITIDLIINTTTVQLSLAAATKENTGGLKLADSPEFADVQITTLKSVATGGVIHNAQNTWLGATAKSVLSYLTEIIGKIFPSHGNTFTGVVDLSTVDLHYSNYTISGALEISIAAGSIIGGSAEGVIIGDGTNTPTLSGITKWVNSGDYVATALTQNHYLIVRFESGVYIIWTQLN